jgi:transcription initiation factor IIF auxiliary subunit
MIRITINRMLISAAFVLGSLSNSFSQTGIKTYNTSNYLGKDRWSWTIYIKASKEILTKVKAVTYTLHHTFQPNRVTLKEIGNIELPYALTGSGWGTFTIKVEINYKDNRPVDVIYHPLTFKQITLATYPITAHNSYKKISDGWWSWTVYITSSKEVLDEIECVEYTLHESFTNPIQLVCDKYSNETAFPLYSRGWGTFEIKIKVIYKDGKTQNLKHQLKFGT